ncbi:alpha/beta hydrolase [Streptomyces turgidiscabies]|uniref:Hydrolase, alpha/beta domain protein n=1 Tax=Streptomyces turgidiscabies (strain Car8) TaxID=698760 RepID=L7EZH8_STRT8|nr:MULTISPECIES: alpha/beta hydrolase [Streptomyces]ELP64299.1 hydrolase, alpha/beta domain protein [Streptomyces turgidiscabies Car8]MDX3499014.1 alpha/beta hydrolase [Streptomyces turgidiscabies]GAQ73463.1 carboxylesterase A precursor [Streptomyces turgidiscabies]
MRSAYRRRALASATTLALLGTGAPTVAAAADEPGLSRFYHQKVTWSACADEAAMDDVPTADLQCAKVTVPLDYARPGGGTLDLAMARYRATGKSRGSVLLNFGGPGGAGVSQLAYEGKDFMGLTNGYDVVTFDPRGVGRSSPVSCGAGESEDDGADTEETDGGAGDDPRAVLEHLRRAAQACVRHSGPVLRHIGTVNASRDLDVMRQALGDKKLNYLGFSYGTRLGAVYAAQFPTKVGRFVLDGVDTLTESLAEQGLAGAAGQQTALEGFLNWCVADIACPFGQDARTARERVVALVGSLDRDPVPTGYGDRFSGQDLVGAIGQGLYSKRMWPPLERALAALVEDGDARGIMGFGGGGTAVPALPRVSAERQSPSPDADGGLVDEVEVPIDNLPAALMAINCADDPDRPGAARITKDFAALRAAYEKASPVFGRYRLTEVLTCYGRPKGTDFIRTEVRDVDTPKMLLVGTRGDPATPYRWTTETAERLGSSAVVLDNKGEGHTGYGSSKCVHRTVDTFLLDGSLPADGSSCGADDAD